MDRRTFLGRCAAVPAGLAAVALGVKAAEPAVSIEYRSILEAARNLSLFGSHPPPPKMYVHPVFADRMRELTPPGTVVETQPIVDWTAPKSVVRTGLPPVGWRSIR